MDCLLEKLDKISIFKIQYRHLQTMQMERKGIVIEKENIFHNNGQGQACNMVSMI